MVIGYNENVFVTDYSNCASVMEAAVNLFQEMKIEENNTRQYINESVLNEAIDIKAIKEKLITIIQTWLSKIRGFIRKIKNIIVEKLMKNKQSKEKIDVTFSFESYNLEKITATELKKFQLFGDDIVFPVSTNDHKYEPYIKDRIKEWTGKSDQLKCTSGEIKSHILEKYCGDKITITEKTPGYSKESFNEKSGEELQKYVTELEKNAEDIAQKLKRSVKDLSGEEVWIRLHNAYFNYTSLNTNLIVALSEIVMDKIALNNKVMSIYTSAKSSTEKDSKTNSHRITQSYTDAVKNKNIRGIRIMIKDSLLTDFSFKQADEMLRLAKNVDGLFDSHDGDELITDTSKWNKDYMNKEMVRIVSNFSHERLNHLKKVVSYVYNK